MRRLALILLAAPALADPPTLLRPPIEPACISSPFGPRPAIGRRPPGHHNGIDLPAPAGAPVRAAAAGRVVFLRRLAGYGMVVELDHGGLRTRYAHLGRVTPALAQGRRDVAAGMPLGVAGRSGITYGTHVHFEVRIGGRPVDPAPFLPGLRPCPAR